MKGPIREIPEEYYMAFTMKEQIPVDDMFMDGRKTEASVPWTDELIESILDHFTLEKIRAGEQGQECYKGAAGFHVEALEKYGDRVKGKHVAVIGTEVPWIEAILVNFGCASVTSVDYNKAVETKYIKTMSYEEFLEQKPKFDAVFSYSSLEHSGLGRYGDDLNPNGDLETVAQIRESMAEGGLFFLGVPVGQDALMWNAHRVYGPKRLPLLLKGFRELEWIGFDKADLKDVPLFFYDHQPLIVLERE